jgi:membrane protease YdiL (CAAX protease family)
LSVANRPFPFTQHTQLATVARVFVFVLLYAVFFVLCAALFATLGHHLLATVSMQARTNDLLAFITVLLTTTFMIRAVDKRSWRELGLGSRAAAPSALVHGLLVGTVAIGVTCALLYLPGWLRVVPSLPGSSLAAGVRVSAFLLVAALSEELLCRGYLFCAIRDSLGTRGAVVATSVIFGLLHTFNPGATVESVLLVTMAGVFLAAVRVVFDSLYAAWAAHTAWNWVMAVPLHAVVSGFRFEAPDYRAVTSGPEWISGGIWGPEGGAVAAVGMLAGFTYLHARRGREDVINDG